jgi:hypothetical protein
MSLRIRCLARFLALGLLPLLLAAPAVGQGHEPSGLDYFHTVAAGGAFDFSGELALPAGFFDEGSARFTGKLAFKGVPLGRYEGKETGDADTVVARRDMPQLGPKFPSRGSARIEIVALSLQSVRPIQVRVGRKVQTWSVKIALSTGRPSTGKMEIVQTSDRGGTFSSEFTIYPVLTFTRKGDGVERTLDVGKLQLSPATEKRLTLRATGAPWSVKAPPNAVQAASRFNVAVRDGTIVVVRHNPKTHIIQPAVIEIPTNVHGQ